MSLDSLVTASLNNGDITYLERFPRMLLSETERQMLAWVMAYTSKFKHAPTVERFRTTDYGIYLTKHLVSSPLPDLFERALEIKRKEYYMAKSHELEELLDSGESLPIQELIQLGRDLASVTAEEDDSFLDFDRESMYDDELPPSMLFGYDTLDQATGGIQPGEYGLLVARTGVGKTLIICDFALRWARAGKKVLIVSCEMPPRQIIGRLDAMMAGFNPRLLRTKSNPALLKLKSGVVASEMEKIREAGGDIRFPKSRAITVSKLRGMISDRKPDIVIVDGVYLLRAEQLDKGAGDWQRLKAISNELKQTCIDLDVAVFGTSQLKRTGKEDGFNLEDIAYGDSLGQDADLVIGATRYKEAANQMALDIMKNRHGDGIGNVMLKINWDDCSIREISWGDSGLEDEDEDEE
jgi:replicative DNA helicase